MKALVRNKGETVLETDGIVGIDWETGTPLTNVYWCGGPYTLVKDYVQPAFIGNGDNVIDSAKYAEIAILKARLAALEKDL